MVTPLSLSIVEGLLNEFYLSNTNNIRKREIETQLITYKNSAESVHECLVSLTDNTTSTNQYLWFFTASTLEHAIVRKWSTLKSLDRNTLREQLWRFYANLPIDGSYPRRQRNTIAQLIALIGKREFPDEHPAYITHVIQLTQNKFSLGITLLKTTSEEVVSLKDDLPTDRKKYFQSCISLCLPEIIDILDKFLAITVNYFNGTDILLNSNINVDPVMVASLPNDNQLHNSTRDLLSCIQHFFSWIPLDNLISDYFLLNIFNLSKWRDQQSEKISRSAISVINELFYLQRAIPSPQVIMMGIKDLLDNSNLYKSSEVYQDRFTELLRLYTDKCCVTLVADEQTFPSLLLSLYNYTFVGNGALAFTERLEIWSPIIRALIPTSFGRYSEIMHLLVGGILKKMQFRFDQEQELDTLDNETLDEDMETEWQHYLNLCIEVIAYVAEGRPIPVFEQVFNDWQRPFETLILLEKSIDNNTSIDLNDQTKCHFIHSNLRDLSSLCQTLVRLAPVLEGGSGKYSENLLQMTQCLLYTVKFLSSNKIHCLNCENSPLMSDFVELFAQTLSAIRCLLPLSPLLKSETELKQLIENVGSILLPSSKQKSRIVSLCAAQLLLSISSVIKPRFMIECYSITQLIQCGPVLAHLPKPVICAIYETVINCLTLPWQNVPSQQQDFEKRNIALQEYIKCISNDFTDLDYTTMGNGQEQKIITITTSILPILKEVLDYFRESSTAVKQMLTNAVKPIISMALSIFNYYGSVSNEITASVSEFCLSVLRTLQMQLGISFVREMLTIFIDSTIREQLSVRRLKSIENILQMVLLVVEQPGNSTMSLIPSILTLSLDHVLPLLLHDKNLMDYAEISYALYALFDGILQHRWQYFFKSQAQRGFSPGASDFVTLPDELPQRSEQLSTILTSYGRGLVNCSNDPHLVRTILISLQNLNERWQLYYRDFFKSNLLQSFQYALLNLMLIPEGAIHQELLLQVLFDMGQVNINKLHESFLSVGFTNNLKFVEEICLSTDFPTFSHKMNQLVQDQRYIRLLQ
ncbi:exportin-6-A [Condylostylus longicornis]|uniref:exportin-6-A n=1 Tax=Condylostylus longicornis TaxID=2530218 RepID=UPI00244E4D6C|nr:exportin-6-A [Condylostylus longicornis]